MRLQQLRYFTLLFQKMLSNVYYYDLNDNKQWVRHRVPIEYGSFVRYDQTTKNNDLNKMRVEVKLPIMNFTLTSLTYDDSNQQAKSARATSICNNDIQTIPYPTPFILNFSVYIRSKNRNEIYDILEQIIPYFTPKKTFKIELVKTHNVIFSDSIGLALNNISERIDNFDDIESKRKVEWQLDFSMNAWLFKTNHIVENGVVDSNGEVIKNNDKDKSSLIENIELSFTIMNDSNMNSDDIAVLSSSSMDESTDVFLYN